MGWRACMGALEDPTPMQPWLRPPSRNVVAQQGQRQQPQKQRNWQQKQLQRQERLKQMQGQGRKRRQPRAAKRHWQRRV